MPCAWLTSGAVQCWGQNLDNLLGDGSGSPKNTPVAATVISGVRQLAVGGFATCALDAGGKVTCWGSKGFVGINPSPADGVPGVTIASGVEELATSDIFTCAAMTGAGVKCWGPNGPQGIGAPDVPKDIPGL